MSHVGKNRKTQTMTTHERIQSLPVFPSFSCIEEKLTIEMILKRSSLRETFHDFLQRHHDEGTFSLREYMCTYTSGRTS